jgi:hypothetical protein
LLIKVGLLFNEIGAFLLFLGSRLDSTAITKSSFFYYKKQVQKEIENVLGIPSLQIESSFI